VESEVFWTFENIKAVKIYVVVFWTISLSGPSTLKMEVACFSKTLVKTYQEK
jgi:hypothetical protein